MHIFIGSKLLGPQLFAGGEGGGMLQVFIFCVLWMHFPQLLLLLQMGICSRWTLVMWGRHGLNSGDGCRMLLLI